LLTAGQFAGQGSALFRNAIVARFISVADMGIGRSFGLTITLLEMATQVAPQVMMIQARDGDRKRLQGVAHMVQVLRGLVMGVLLLIIAEPVARLFDVPEALWAFRAIALIPVIESFHHLDIRRLQRDLNYGPAVGVTSFSQLATLVLAWPLAVWLGDYSVIFWLLLLKTLLFVVGSHIVAQRPYRIVWDRHYIDRILRFGWPLLINGLVLCVLRQGDHMILGATYGMAVLGVYANAYLLVVIPSRALGQIGGSLMLPLLAAVQDDVAQYRQRYATAIQVVSLLAIGLGVSFAVMGGRLVALVFGAPYESAGEFVGWLGAMAALRMIRVVPNQAAVALADTRNPMISNFWSGIGLVGIAVAAFLQAHIAWIAFFCFVGEICAVSAALLRLKRRHGLPLSATLRPIAVLFFALAAGSLAVRAGITDAGWLPELAIVAAAVLVSLLFGLVAFGLFKEVPRLLLSSRLGEADSAPTDAGGGVTRGSTKGDVS
jgi:O-antigen/teichoic acid export membrane protein